MFYDYQKEWLNDKSQFRIWLKARQIGASETVAYEAVVEALKNKKDNNTNIISNMQSNAGKLLEKCKKYVQLYAKKYKNDTGKTFTLRKENSGELVFPNGNYISSMASNPDNVRGRTGHVVLDEYAFHKEQGKIYSACLPMVSLGYNLSIISTPLGAQDMFYEIFNNQDQYPDFSRHKTDIREALEMGCKQNIEAIEANMTAEDFEQEYMCKFVNDRDEFFTWDLLKHCYSDYNRDQAFEEYYMGVDVGRSHDLTAIVIIGRKDGIFYLRELETLKKVDFTKQFEICCKHFENYNPKYLYIDKGFNPQLAEDLEKKYHTCKGIYFGGNTKSEMATNVKKLMEQGKFKVDATENELLKDIHSVKRKVNGNSIQFDTPRDERGHGDRFWALALALKSVDTKRHAPQIFRIKMN